MNNSRRWADDTEVVRREEGGAEEFRKHCGKATFLTTETRSPFGHII